MRIVFMGTPDFSVPVLQALMDSGHDVVAAYSQPPRRAGRGKALTPSPVQARAEALGIRVLTPVSLRDPEAQAEFAALGADVAVVAAYGLILPRAVLEAPRLGCLNVHASLLPRWRGAAPIQRAILAGDTETGVCIMQMETGLDTGPVRLREHTSMTGTSFGRLPGERALVFGLPRPAAKTAGQLTDELSAMGARLMVQVLSDVAAYPPVAQVEAEVTYAPKIEKAEARIDWSRSAVEIERQVRAYNPTPGAFFEVGGERIKILARDISHNPDLRQGAGEVLDSSLLIGCGVDAIRPTLLQRAGRDVMRSAELLRGFPIPPGTQLA